VKPPQGRTGFIDMSFHEVLVSHGYKIVEDAWEKDGRRTYVHDEDATRAHLASLARMLRTVGWDRDPDKVRGFRHATSRQVIELEPGGSETTGHISARPLNPNAHRSRHLPKIRCAQAASGGLDWCGWDGGVRHR
jgi:hypothetical protein